MKLPLVILISLFTAAIGFFGGVQYQRSKNPAFSNRLAAGQFPGVQGRSGQSNGQNRLAGFRPVSGEILSSDDSTLTVKLEDGSSKIIILSDTTEINTAETGTRADLSAGTRVAVFGTENPDGSVTAQNIQLNPRLFTITPTPVEGGDN